MAKYVMSPEKERDNKIPSSYKISPERREVIDYLVSMSEKDDKKFTKRFWEQAFFVVDSTFGKGTHTEDEAWDMVRKLSRGTVSKAKYEAAVDDIAWMDEQSKEAVGSPRRGRVYYGDHKSEPESIEESVSEAMDETVSELETAEPEPIEAPVEEPSLVEEVAIEEPVVETATVEPVPEPAMVEPSEDVASVEEASSAIPVPEHTNFEPTQPVENAFEGDNLDDVIEGNDYQDSGYEDPDFEAFNSALTSSQGDTSYKDRLLPWDASKAYQQGTKIATAVGGDVIMSDVIAEEYQRLGYSPTAMGAKNDIVRDVDNSIVEAAAVNVAAGFGPKESYDAMLNSLGSRPDADELVEERETIALFKNSDNAFDDLEYYLNEEKGLRDNLHAIQQEWIQENSPLDKSVGGIVTDFGAFLIPFYEVINLNKTISRLKDKGYDVDSPLWNRIFVGEMKNDIREYMDTLSDEEKARKFHEVADIITSSSGFFGDNAMLASTIISETITDPNMYGFNGWRIADNLFSLLDLSMVGGVLKAGGKTLKGAKTIIDESSTMAKQARVNKEAAEETAARIVAAEGDDAAEIAARVGTTKEEVIADSLQAKWGEVESVSGLSTDNILAMRERAVEFMRGTANKLRHHFSDAEKVMQANALVKAMSKVGGLAVEVASSTVSRSDFGLKFTGVFGKGDGIGLAADEVAPALKTMVDNLDDKTLKLDVYRKNYDGSTTKLSEKEVADMAARTSDEVPEVATKLEEAEAALRNVINRSNANRRDVIGRHIYNLPLNLGALDIPNKLKGSVAGKAVDDFVYAAVEQGYDVQRAHEMALEAFDRAILREPIPKGNAGKQVDDKSQYFIGVDTVTEYKTMSSGVGLQGKLADIIASGNRSTWLWDVSAGLSKYLSNSFYNAFDQSRKTERVMNSFLEPFVKSSNKAKKITLNILSDGAEEVHYLADGTKVVGKNYSIEEILGKLPPNTDPKIVQEVVDGYHAVRMVGDIAHTVANSRTRAKLVSQGKKWLKVGESSFAASRVSDDAAQNIKAYYDPLTGVLHEADVSPTRIKQLQSEGYTFHHSNELHGYKDSKTNYIITKEGAHSIEELPTQVLNYREGYIPRIYEEQYYITVSNPAMKINGELQTGSNALTKAIRAVRSRDEADALIKELKEASGEEGAHLVYDWKHARELTRHSNKDAVARAENDIEEFTKGMFYSHRGEHLGDFSGSGLARTKDPVSSISRMTATIARQMDVAPVLELHKQRWMKHFAHLTNGVYPDSAKQIGTVSKVGSEEIDKARAYWNYIDLQELNSTSEWWKVNMFRFGEMLEDVGLKRTGSFFREHVSAHDPLSITRGATFVATLVFNPFRQVFVQSSQIMFLAGIDPKGVMSGQVQTLGAALAAGMDRSGKVASKLGFSKDEWRDLVKGFEDSGLSEAVNSHMFSRDALNNLNVEATSTKLGAAAKTVDNTIRKGIGVVKRAGFDAGEAWNVGSTYVVAYKRWRKANPTAKFDDGAKYAVANDARQLSLGMTQAGSYGYQKGLLSLTTQFMSIQHKAFSVFLRGTPFTKGKFGNQALSVPEARRVMAGQALLYGAAGYGLHGVVDKVLDKFNIDVGPEVRNILVGGMYDTVVSYALMLGAEDDKGHTFDFSQHIAAGSGWADTLMDKIRDFSETSAIDFFAGPSSTLFSRVGNAFRLTQQLVMSELSGGEYDTAESAQLALDGWLSIASFYNNAVKGWAMAQSGTYVDKTLKPLALDASRREAVIRAVFGVGTHEEASLYDVYMTASQKRKKMQKLVEHTKADISRIAGLKGEYGEVRGFENVMRAIRHRADVLAMLYGKTEARQIMQEATSALFKEDAHGGDRSLQNWIWRNASEGTYTFDKEMGTMLFNRGLVDEDTANTLNRVYDELMQAPEGNN